MDLQPTLSGASASIPPAAPRPHTASQLFVAAAGASRHYLTYGLRIASELPLAELLPAAGDAPPDVALRLAAIPRPPLPVPADDNGAFEATAGEVYCYYPGVGKFLVRGGKEIVVEPDPAVDESTLRFFALGVASGMVLHQRGTLALHASAVGLGAGAVAFLAESGEGKSTLAAFLHRRGHRLLADDIVALADDAGAPQVLPSFPQLKLWPDAVAGLGGDPAALPGLMADFEKLAYRPERAFLTTPLPLRRLYILAHGDRPALTPLAPQDALLELVRNTYALRFIGSAGVTPAHLRQCAAIARAVPVALLRRPYDFAAFPAVAALIERDAASPEVPR